MGSMTGNALVTKAKAIYGNFLTSENFIELSKKRSVQEVAGYLKNHPNYSDVLADIQEASIHRGQLEELIKKNSFDHVLKLVKFIELKDKSFYHLNLMHREIELILSTIRLIISGNIEIGIAEFPTYFVRHASFDISALSRARTFAMLLEALKTTKYYDVLRSFHEEDRSRIKYAEIEHQLESFYYDTVFARIKENYRGRLKTEIENIFLTRIELDNIVKIYRMKKFYNADANTIREMLFLNHSRISSSRFEEIIAITDPDQVLEHLAKSEYAQYTEGGDYVYIEYYAEKIKYNLAKHYMYYYNDAPIVFSALLILEEIEKENIFHIIEGIRYGLNENEIRRMLIF